MAVAVVEAVEQLLALVELLHLVARLLQLLEALLLLVALVVQPWMVRLTASSCSFVSNANTTIIPPL